MPFIPDPLSPWDVKNVRIASLSKTANNVDHHEKMMSYHHDIANSLDRLADKYKATGNEDSYNQFALKAVGHRLLADAHREVRDYMNNAPKPDNNPE